MDLGGPRGGVANCDHPADAGAAGCINAAETGIVRPACSGVVPSVMDTIFRGDVATARGRALAWVDALVIDHAVFRLAWSNLGEGAPGRLYRSNHPLPGRLARLVRRHGLRTLINLRGLTNPGSDALSRDAAARLGLDFVDMALESRGAPQRDRILRLHDIYRDMRAPALLHCKSGADRAGIMSVFYMHFRRGQPIREALKQLSPRYLHTRAGKPGVLDYIFERYFSEAEPKGISFFDWTQSDAYDPVKIKAEFKAHWLFTLLTEGVLRRE